MRSVGQKIIRLTDERWMHIVENHTEIAGLRQGLMETLYEPDVVVCGRMGELFAIRYYKQLGNHLIVVYKESKEDGFIITAFRARDIRPYLRKDMVWKKQ